MAFPLTKNINYKNNVLHIDNCSIDYIAEQIGTPFYVYSKARLIENIASCKTAFLSHNIHIHYAVKANSNLQILKTVAEQGLGADLVSGGELLRAKKAGITPEKMIFSGVGKNRTELIQAIKMHVGQFNVESAEELSLLSSLTMEHSSELTSPIKVALRVNPHVAVDTHKKITTGQKGNKFGIETELALLLFQKYLNHPHMKLMGLAMHIGSQIFDVSPYQEAIKKLLNLTSRVQKLGGDIQVLDLGGGFGINYGDKSPLDFTTIAQVIAEETKHFKGKVAIEPGRSLVADIGLLVSRINYVKESQPTPFLIVDAAMNDLMRPALYDALHPIKAVKEHTSSTTRLYDVVGPVCESTDIFAHKYPLDKNLKAGDLIAFFCSGAYSAVMSNSYNSRDVIPEMLVSNDKVNIIRKKISQEHLIKFEESEESFVF